MKRLVLLCLFCFAAVASYGQPDTSDSIKENDERKHDNLELVRPDSRSGASKQYWDNLLPLLHKRFSEKPVAIYTSLPSFQTERAFSVEKKGNRYFIISNSLSESYWYAKQKHTHQGYTSTGIAIARAEFDVNHGPEVKVYSKRVKIDKRLFDNISYLFRLLAQQTKEKEKKPTYKLTKTGILFYAEKFSGDGISSYFTTTNDDGVVVTGVASSGTSGPLLKNLVNICNRLYAMGNGEDIDQREINVEIEALIKKLELNN